MSPDICTICERAFRRVKKSSHVSGVGTILFADIRGYTKLLERMDPIQLSTMVSAFQDKCAQGIWAHDGIVNKQMGDGLMAHLQLPDQDRAPCRGGGEGSARDPEALQGGAGRHGDRRLGQAPEGALGVGVGVHTGPIQIGEFSTSKSDFTAIGGTVNLAARLEAQAAPGEILVSAETAALAPVLMAGTATRTLTLKGIEQPVRAQSLSVAG